jgi:hypothetical protein
LADSCDARSAPLPIAAGARDGQSTTTTALDPVPDRGGEDTNGQAERERQRDGDHNHDNHNVRDFQRFISLRPTSSFTLPTPGAARCRVHPQATECSKKTENNEACRFVM